MIATLAAAKIMLPGVVIEAALLPPAQATVKMIVVGGGGGRYTAAQAAHAAPAFAHDDEITTTRGLVAIIGLNALHDTVPPSEAPGVPVVGQVFPAAHVTGLPDSVKPAPVGY